MSEIKGMIVVGTFLRNPDGGGPVFKLADFFDSSLIRKGKCRGFGPPPGVTRDLLRDAEKKGDPPNLYPIRVEITEF